MASPGIFGFSGMVADNDHIVGPVVTTFAIIALWECTRVVRTYNIPLGGWLLLAPWILGYDDTTAIANDMAVGALLIFFSLVKGKVQQRFGGGWSAIVKSDALHQKEARTFS